VAIDSVELHVETDEQLKQRLAFTFVENGKLWFGEYIEHRVSGFENLSQA
jgi:hypothetical protein